MRILIMGYMASGKSTIGKLLARELSYDFIDMDKFIEEKENNTIAGIFESEGEEIFRRKEKKYLLQILKKENIVIAAGGGTPCFFDNIELINTNTVSVYLKLSSAELHQRLSKNKLRRIRPLLKNLTKENLLDFIKKQLAEREKIYLKADLTINGYGKTEEELTNEITEEIFKNYQTLPSS